jgi:RNA polymerase sigma-70 factor, ECF subfamily
MSGRLRMTEPSAWMTREAFGAFLHLARRGDLEARGKILDAFRRVLRRQADLAEPLELRQRCSPSDLVQDTLLEAHRDFGQFQGTTPHELAAWLLRILRHTLSDVLRQNASLKRGLGRELPFSSFQVSDYWIGGQADRSPRPRDGALDHERAEATRQALLGLSLREREAIRLRYEENLAYEEIGVRLGCSAEAARKVCVRALHELGVAVSGFLEKMH